MSGIEIDGIRLACVASGIKKNGGTDLVLIEAVAGSAVAATFTQNKFCAAPVLLARKHLGNINQAEKIYLLINSGNANAGTGAPGMKAAKVSCEAIAVEGGVSINNVLPFSTGVIGELLPVEKIESATPLIVEGLQEDTWPEAAAGIMTTDTVAKLHSSSVTLFGKEYSLCGISKGAGMIKPNMATMLAYMACDVSIEPQLLQEILNEAVRRSFNRITIDGDTSTNDACVLIATGQDLSSRIRSRDQVEYQQFKDAVFDLALVLAQLIIKDGEGATKFVHVSITGGATESDCEKVAYAVAESPLVKTALFSSDPNWGRILAAAGRSGAEHLDIDKLTLHINALPVASDGGIAVDYNESAVANAMQGRDISIAINLNLGDAEFEVWTADLSHDYVSINADYRT